MRKSIEELTEEIRVLKISLAEEERKAEESRSLESRTVMGVKRFEIFPRNLIGHYTSAQAREACIRELDYDMYSEEGQRGGWRMPTKDELSLMFFSGQLTKGVYRSSCSYVLHVDIITKSNHSTVPEHHNSTLFHFNGLDHAFGLLVRPVRTIID